MTFIFAFLLIAGLEIASANDKPPPKEQAREEAAEDIELCLGCEGKEEKNMTSPPLTVEIIIDPVTGSITYVIKGLVIE